jgi:sugar lactone lactonase YvrE
VTVAGWPYTGASRSVDGVGTAARFSGLGGMARVGDALYVADTFNHTVRRVSLSDFSVTTVAGAAGVAGEVDGAGTAARFDAPQGLAVAGGALYAAGFSGTLRRIALPGHEVSTVLGVEGEAYARDGQGAAVRLGTGFAPPIAHPTGKELFYQDRSANSLRRVDLEGLVVQTYAGALEPELHRDGTLEAARFVAPTGLAVNAAGTRWFVADAAAQVIREVDATSGTVRTIAGSPGQWGAVDGTGEAARFDVPLALAYDEPSGRLYVADTYNGCLRTVEVESGAVSTLAGRCGEPGTEDGTGTAARLLEPVALALDVAAGRLFFSEVAGEDLLPGGRAAIRQVMLATGEVTTVAGGARAPAMPVDGDASGATFDAPTALAWDQDGGRLFIAEQAAAAIRALHLPSGTVSLVAGKYGERGPADGSPALARFDAPSGLAVDAATQTLLVSDSGANTLRRLALDDGTVSTWLGDPARGGGFVTPQPLDTATLYLPTAPVVAGGVVGWLGEMAVYRVSTQAAAAP